MNESINKKGNKLSNEHIIVGFNNDEYKHLVELYSDISNRSYLFIDIDDNIDNLKLLFSRYKSITFIAHPNSFGIKCIETLIDCLKFMGSNLSKIPWGIMTGKTPEELVGLFYRTQNVKFGVNQESDLYISTKKINIDTASQPDLFCIDPEMDIDIYKSTVSSLNDKKFRDMVLMQLHSREYCGALHPGGELYAALCSSYKSYSENGKCGYGLSCYGDINMKRIDISSIPTQILFMGSCQGIRFTDGCVPPDMSLALNFVSGNGVAMIAPFTVIGSVYTQVLCFYKLWKSGHPLGECVRLVNNLIISKEGIISPYILMGDPLISLDDNVDYEKVFSITESNISESDKIEMVYCLNTPNSYKRVSIKVGNKELSGMPEVISFFDEIENEYNELYSNQLLYFCPEIYSQLRKITTIGNSISVDSKKFNSSNIFKAMSKYNELIKMIQQHIVGECIKRAEGAEWFYQNYMPYFRRLSDATKEVECPNCNNISNELEYVHKSIEVYRRKSIYCPKCGIVEDKHDDHLIIEFIEFPDDIYASNTDKQKISLRLHNKGEREARGVMGACVFLTQAAVQPAFIDFKIPPNEYKEISLEINTSQLIHTMHYFRLIYINHFKLYSRSYPFVLWP